MKKINYAELIVQIFVVLLFAVCLWILPLRRIPNFWISFFFSIATLILYIYLCSWWSKKKSASERFLYLIYPIGSAAVFLVHVIWNLFVLLVSLVTVENILGVSKDTLLGGTPLKDAPIKAAIEIVEYVTKVDILDVEIIKVAVPVNIIVNLICVFAYVTIIYGMSRGVQEIRRIDNHVQTVTSFVRDMERELQLLARNPAIGAEAKQKLNTLIEQVKYSDPVSNDSLESIERDVRSQINVLKEQILLRDDEQTMAAIDNICLLMEQRSMLCKISK